MENQLKGLNLEFEIIKAVDGQALTEDDLKGYSERETIKCVGTALSHGAIACALSHARMWHRIIEEDLSEVLILEDDALFGESLIDQKTTAHTPQLAAIGISSPPTEGRHYELPTQF